MSKSNQVQPWRFGRTRALFVTQKLLNRAKTGVLKGTWNFSWVQFNFFWVQKTQLEHNNWKISSILSGLVTRRLYFKKKKETKQPFSPSSGNWPICSFQYNKRYEIGLTPPPFTKNFHKILFFFRRGLPLQTQQKLHLFSNQANMMRFN